MKYCECLIDIVGLKNICEPPDGCTLYLDDLPNISREALALLTDSDRKKISLVFEDIEKRAAAKTYLEIVSKMQGNFLKNKPTKRIITGQFQENDQLITFPQDRLIGKRIYIGDSEYIGINIEQILIWSESDVIAANFYVYDLYTGLLIENFTSDLIGGRVNSINLSGKKYSSKGDIFIGYNASEVHSKSASNINEYYDTYCECQCGQSSCKYYEYSIGADLTDLRIYEDSLNGSTDCGLILFYTKRCDFDEFICRNIDSGIGLILQYQMGIEFWKEDRLDNVLNWYALIGDEKKFQYRSDLEDDLEQALKNFVQQVDGDEVCFKCSKYGAAIDIQIP